MLYFDFDLILKAVTLFCVMDGSKNNQIFATETVETDQKTLILQSPLFF